MSSRTRLPRELLQAYRRTLYQVKDVPKPFVLRIGEKSSLLASLMRKHRAASAMFLTAYNPYSQKIQASRNVRAQRALKNEIEKNGWLFFEGKGVDPTGCWKAEPSLLVLGVPRQIAKAMAAKYRQNAMVWAGVNAVPRMVLIR